MSQINTEKIFNQVKAGQALAYALQKELKLAAYPNFEVAESYDEDGKKYIFLKAETANLPDKLADLNRKIFGKTDYGFHPVIETEGAEHTMIALPVELLKEATDTFKRLETAKLLIPKADEPMTLQTEVPTLTACSFSDKFRDSAKRLNKILSRLGILIADSCEDWWSPQNTIDVEDLGLRSFNKNQSNTFCSPLLDISPEELELKISGVNNLLSGKGIQLSVAVDPQQQERCYLAIDSNNISPQQISTHFDEIMDTFAESHIRTQAQRLHILAAEAAAQTSKLAALGKSITQRIFIGVQNLLKAA